MGGEGDHEVVMPYATQTDITTIYSADALFVADRDHDGNVDDRCGQRLTNAGPRLRRPVTIATGITATAATAAAATTMAASKYSRPAPGRCEHVRVFTSCP